MIDTKFSARLPRLNRKQYESHIARLSTPNDGTAVPSMNCHDSICVTNMLQFSAVVFIIFVIDYTCHSLARAHTTTSTLPRDKVQSWRCRITAVPDTGIVRSSAGETRYPLTMRNCLVRLPYGNIGCTSRRQSTYTSLSNKEYVGRHDVLPHYAAAQ